MSDAACLQHHGQQSSRLVRSAADEPSEARNPQDVLAHLSGIHFNSGQPATSVEKLVMLRDVASIWGFGAGVPTHGQRGYGRVAAVGAGSQPKTK